MIIEKIEPHYILRAIADKGKPLVNQDVSMLVKFGDKVYDLGVNAVDMRISTANKVTISLEMDLNELGIDMPITLIEPDGEESEDRVKISGSSIGGPLNSSCDLDVEIEDQKDVHLSDLELTISGETDTNSLKGYVIRRPG